MNITLQSSIRLMTHVVALSYGVTSVAFAADFSIPHVFKSGDIISAEAFNEINSEIRQSRKSWTNSDVLGTWSCSSIAAADANPVSGWQSDKDGLYMELTNATMTFSDDRDGTYSFTTSSPNPLDTSDATAMSTTSFAVAHSFFWFKTFYTTPGGATTANVNRYTITPLSSTRFVLKRESQTLGSPPVTLTCDKKASVPQNPTNLTISATGSNVALSWKDNSSNETGFKVLRKDSLTADYQEIATPVVDISIYTDTVSTAGTYWYRVKATNDVGDSLGSNIVRFRYAP